MKKFFKLFIINILGLFILLTVAEYITYSAMLKSWVNKTPFEWLAPNEKFHFFLQKSVDVLPNVDYVLATQEFETLTSDNPNKKPIILFGDSYVRGGGVSPEKTISYLLYKQTNRTIYNRAFWGWGIQHMLYQLQDENVRKVLPENPEYVIFVYEDSLMHRAINPVFVALAETKPYLTYDMKDGKLTQYKPLLPFLYKFYLFKSIKAKLVDFDEEKEPIITKELFLESKKEIERYYPQAKFIILKYSQSDISVYNPNNQWIWEDLKKQGIQVVDTKDLTDENLNKPPYTQSEDDLHPSDEAWRIIVPKFIKKVGI